MPLKETLAQMKSVLVVEDNESLGRSVTHFLRGRGLDVTHAATLGDAKTHLDGNAFDAVLLDVGLPDGNGLDLIESTGPERVLVMTTTPDPVKFERYGVTHFLQKPFDLEDLLQALRSIVEV